MPQEKYLSEHNYDEAVDEGAASQLLSFGDDYRNFLDSLSDGFSSNANNAGNAAIADSRKRRYRKFKVQVKRWMNVNPHTPFDPGTVIFSEGIYCPQAPKQVDIKPMLLHGSVYLSA